MLVNRQWLKMLVWQLCLSKGLLFSNSVIDSTSFHFPVEIAREAILVSILLPLAAFQSNGVEILERILDIGNTALMIATRYTIHLFLLWHNIDYIERLVEHKSPRQILLSSFVLSSFVLSSAMALHYRNTEVAIRGPVACVKDSPQPQIPLRLLTVVR